MDSISPTLRRMAHEALIDFPRPDEMAQQLLTKWLLTHGITLSPRDIDVVTVHYQYEPLGEGRSHFRENAIARQKMDLVGALLANWQGETASGHGGFHYGNWAGRPPSGPLHLVERLAPVGPFSNADAYQVFNGLYRRTTPAQYSPDTLLPLRAEAFQAFIWSLRFHQRFKEDLQRYWQRQENTYPRALRIALLAACNKQVAEGSLNASAQALVWKAAGVVPATGQVRLSMLNVYGYSAVSILRIADPRSHLNVLYIPGNASPLHTFDTALEMKHWFARQCRSEERREALLHHFKRADWPDGLDFSGLRTALIGLGVFPEVHRFSPDHPGFATSGRWDPEYIVDYRPERYSPAISGDLFAYLAGLQQQRAYADADNQIVSNHQIERAHWGSYLRVSINILMPLAIVVPPIAPLLAVAGVVQFSFGLEQVIHGTSLEAKVEGVEQQVFGVLNALPLAAEVIGQAPALFEYRRPGFVTWADMREQLNRAPTSETDIELAELTPATAAFRPPTVYEQSVETPFFTQVNDALFPQFRAYFDVDGYRSEESVELELSSNAFIKSREVRDPAAQRWVASPEPRGAMQPLEGTRPVDDAARMATLRSLGIHVDLPLSAAPFDALQTRAIPKRVASLWVGDQVIGDPFLETLAHNARALRGSDYTFELYLSRQSPQAFERNSALLAARAAELSVRVLEDQPFYQDFAHSACFPQLQAALNVAGTGAGNFSSACDILRLQLLKRLGGLYLDADDRLLVTTVSGQPHAHLFDIPLRTIDDGLLLAPPVSNDQLGLYFKFNSSMIGSHPDNPTLDAVLDEMQARYADDTSFYASRPDAQHDPVAFGAYARRLNRLTGPGLLNDVIDARLPWLRQLRELCVLMVAPVTDVHRMINLRWLNQLLRLHLPLDRVAKIGHANSWRTVR